MKSEKIASIVIAIGFLLLLIAFSIWVQRPTELQILVARVVLALAAAALGIILPGALEIDIGNYLKASGALAMFALVFTVNPPMLVSESGAGDNATVEKPSARPSVPARELQIVRDGTFHELVAGTQRLSVRLVDVDTLKGKKKDQPNTGHPFNQQNFFSTSPGILKRIFEGVALPDSDAERLTGAPQDEWDDYLESLSREKRRAILDFPMAQLKISVDGREVQLASKWWIRSDELLALSAGTLILADVNNTRQSVQSESVTLSFVPTPPNKR